MPIVREAKDKMRQAGSEVLELHQVTCRLYLPGTTPATTTQKEAGGRRVNSQA